MEKEGKDENGKVESDSIHLKLMFICPGQTRHVQAW